jgi:hypothetical protein
MSESERVELRVDGSRVRFSGTPPEMWADIETQITVTNRRRVPLVGAIRLTDLPPGWTNEDDDVQIAVDPGTSRRITLQTRAATVGPQPDGALRAAVELAGADGVVYRRTVRVSFISAATTGPAPRIDGDLSDWPPGAQNVAANFRLISGQPQDDPGLELSRPAARTTAFVQRDAEALYIAVTCEKSSNSRPPAARRKGVRYEDLVPIEEEDLIEILVDPTNGGTRSPSDLFHIVVKESGTDLAEKGVLTTPPSGVREPWPVNIEVAAATSGRRWMAELRVPLSDISRDAVGGAVWGFNVTRWDASRQEFSNWSAAVGNAYDPLSLGNLYLP